MDFQPQPIHLIALLAAGMFIAMIWKIPTWNSFGDGKRIFITIMLPIVSYGIASFMADRP